MDPHPETQSKRVLIPQAFTTQEEQKEKRWQLSEKIRKDKRSAQINRMRFH